MVKKRKRTSDEAPELESGMTDDGRPPKMEAEAQDRSESEITGEGMADSEAAVMEAPEAEAEAQATPEAESDVQTPPAEALPAVEELGALQMASELERARRERQEFLDGWQRARAEFANYRKRVERDQEDARARIAGETLLPVLGVLDDLERALKDRPADGDAAAWADGIEMIYRKFQALLESAGVHPIRAEGQSFDPSIHEALSHEESEGHSEGDVIEVVQRGYCVGDRVLRPALVRVAK